MTWDESYLEADDDGDEAHALPIPSGTWQEYKSLWNLPGRNMTAGRWATFTGAKAMGAGSMAVGAAAHVGAGGIAAGVGAGAAVTALTVGTGGLAVAAAAGGMQIASMGLGVVSAVKTWDHLKAIAELGGQSYACTALPGGGGGEGRADHGHIQFNIIPYIINKKSAKFGKKLGAGIGLGALVSLYSVGKKAYKGLRGTLGKRRSFYAYVIARHMITHDCKLCEALIGELFTPDDYGRLKTMNSTDASGWIAVKMKSN